MKAIDQDVIFILDGGAGPDEPCGIAGCLEKSQGSYEVCDADTLKWLATVGLCATHGQSLATGMSFLP